jgi:hypothetical protein
VGNRNYEESASTRASRRLEGLFDFTTKVSDVERE